MPEAEPALPAFTKPPPTVHACVHGAGGSTRGGMLQVQQAVAAGGDGAFRQAGRGRFHPCSCYAPHSLTPHTLRRILSPSLQVRTSGPAAGNGFEIILQVWGLYGAREYEV